MSTVEQSGTALLTSIWERNYLPHTGGIISGFALADDARCLDLGAGGGGMSHWLAERVPRGSVTALDTDVSQIDPTRSPNLTVVRGDLTEADFAPGSFDLVLARAVLSSVPDPDAAVAAAARWLAPGGTLLVEDFYYLPVEDAPSEAARAVLRAYLEEFRTGGVDVRWARRLTATLARVGLADIGARVTPLGPGQSPQENELIATRLRLQGRPLVDNGLATEEDIAEFTANLDRPEGRDVAVLMFSAWGRKR